MVMWNFDYVQTIYRKYDNNDRREWDDIQFCPFRYDELLKVCENLFSLLDSLKTKYSNLKKDFAAMDKSLKPTFFELGWMKKYMKSWKLKNLS